MIVVWFIIFERSSFMYSFEHFTMSRNLSRLISRICNLPFQISSRVTLDLHHFFVCIGCCCFSFVGSRFIFFHCQLSKRLIFFSHVINPSLAKLVRSSYQCLNFKWNCFIAENKRFTLVIYWHLGFHFMECFTPKAIIWLLFSPIPGSETVGSALPREHE